MAFQLKPLISVAAVKTAKSSAWGRGCYQKHFNAKKWEDSPSPGQMCSFGHLSVID